MRSFRLLAAERAHRQQHLAAHFGRRIGRPGPESRRAVFAAVPPQNPHGQGTKRRVVAGFNCSLDDASAGAANAIQHPQRAGRRLVRLGIRLAVRGKLFERRDARRPVGQQSLAGQKLRGQVGAFQAFDRVGNVRVRARLVASRELLARRRQQKDAALIGIVVGVSADAAVVPIGNVQPAVGRGANVVGAKIIVALVASETLRWWPSCRSRPARGDRRGTRAGRRRCAAERFCISGRRRRLRKSKCRSASRSR